MGVCGKDEIEPLELQAWLPGLGAEVGLNPSHWQPGLAPPMVLTPESGSRESLGVEKEMLMSALPLHLYVPNPQHWTGHLGAAPELRCGPELVLQGMGPRGLPGAGGSESGVS